MHSVVLGLQCLAEEMGRISIFHALGCKTQLKKQVCLLPSFKSLALVLCELPWRLYRGKKIAQKAERSFQTHVDAFCRDVSLVIRFWTGIRGGTVFALILFCPDPWGS